jgi:hypothetical protein
VPHAQPRSASRRVPWATGAALVTCGRCDDPEGIITVSDSLDETATICPSCAAAWVREVVDNWDAPLRVFTGTATADERRAHAERVAAETAAEADAARRKIEAKTHAEARAAKLLDDRATAAARFVAGRSERASLPEVAAAVGVSRRTLSRVLPHALQRGLVTVTYGPGGGVGPGPVSIPRDPERAGIEAAELRLMDLAAKAAA